MYSFFIFWMSVSAPAVQFSIQEQLPGKNVERFRSYLRLIDCFITQL